MPIRFICADNLEAMSGLMAEQARATLVYMDPPFRTGKKQTGAAGSFDDPMLSMDEFVHGIVMCATSAWMLMRDCGSLVVHVDPKTSHYVKVALDKYLGEDHFASEIIWRYRRWSTKTPNFQRVHDVLLRYVHLPGEQTWNQLYEPIAPSTMKAFGGRKQRAVFTDGRREKSTTTSEESPGVPMGDVWDIPIIAPMAKERTKYPTQKPEALLERLVLACTNPGDLVLSPYCGSGTVAAVCQRLGRGCIEIDSNPDAIRVAKERIEK